MLTIPDKRTFYRLAMEGKCGNVPMMWPSLEAFIADGAPVDPVGIRLFRPADQRFRAFVPRDELLEHGVRLSNGEYILSETLVPNRHKIQGELSHIKGEWTFYYSMAKYPMRPALQKEGRHAYGWGAIELLKRYATPADVDDIFDLIEIYGNGSIETCIELTVTTHPFGTIPNRNTIIWEIRQY